MRPKVFFDTCVYSEAVKQSGRISPDDWDFINDHVQKHNEVRVSWTTIKELLCRLASCSDEYFVRDQAALKYAGGHGLAPGGFLEKPHVFAIKHSLGINVYPQLDREGRPNISHQQWTEDVLNSVFRASSKLELLNGVPLGPETKMMGTFDLDDFAAHEEKARSEFVRLSEGWRTGTIDPPNKRTVAANLLQESGVTPYTELCQKLSDALDAVNLSIDWFWNISKNIYSFEKHKNNWDDIQQLYYLCDSSMTFVTLNTKDFMKWTKNSTQVTQVISLQQFIDNARQCALHIAAPCVRECSAGSALA